MTLDLGPAAPANGVRRAAPPSAAPDGAPAGAVPVAPGWMTLGEAAAALGVDKATVSRNARHCAEAARRDGHGRLVAVDAERLRQWRAANINRAMAGNAAGRLMGEVPSAAPAAPASLPPHHRDHDHDRDDDDAAAGDPMPAPAAERRQSAPSYAAVKAVREGALARKAQLDLEERLGRVLPRAEVEHAAAEAGRLLKTELAAAARRSAERTAALTDPAAIAAVIDREHAAALERVHHAVAGKLGLAAAA